MLAPSSSLEAGQRLKAMREALRLSTREVARLSRQIAEEKGDQAYSVSRSLVTEVENGKFRPKFPKLYSLCLIYHCGINEMLALFRITPGDLLTDLLKEQSLVALPHTHAVGSGFAGPVPLLLTRLELKDTVQLQRTDLANRMVQGDLALLLLQQASTQNLLYGYVGTDDRTLDPIIRPGTWVEIDSRLTKVTKGMWANEYERPIFFTALRDDRFAVSWCEFDGNHLLLVPCPTSQAPIRHVRYPQDAEILGQVTAIGMRIVPLPSQATGLILPR
jgi:transcriptional regulator with XRE-family HTH domain